MESVLSGPHFAAFFQITAIFMSGFGKLNIDSDLLFVRLVYEKKFSLKNFAILVLLEHHVKSRANQLKIISIYTLSVIKY